MEDTQEVEVIEETTVEDAVAADAIPVQDMTAPDATEREIAAAALIQRVYRKILGRRRGVAKRGKEQVSTLNYIPHASGRYPGSVITPDYIFACFLGPTAAHSSLSGDSPCRYSQPQERDES